MNIKTSKFSFGPVKKLSMVLLASAFLFYGCKSHEEAETKGVSSPETQSETQIVVASENLSEGESLTLSLYDADGYFLEDQNLDCVVQDNVCKADFDTDQKEWKVLLVQSGDGQYQGYWAAKESVEKEIQVQELKQGVESNTRAVKDKYDITTMAEDFFHINGDPAQGINYPNIIASAKAKWLAEAKKINPDTPSWDDLKDPGKRESCTMVGPYSPSVKMVCFIYGRVPLPPQPKPTIRLNSVSCDRLPQTGDTTIGVTMSYNISGATSTKGALYIQKNGTKSFVRNIDPSYFRTYLALSGYEFYVHEIEACNSSGCITRGGPVTVPMCTL